MKHLTIDQILQLAINSHKSGNLQQAEKFYTAILEIKSDHIDANYNLGILALQLSKPDKSVPFFERALQANPQQGNLWIGLIEALIQADEIDTAKRVLKQGKRHGLSGEAADKLTAYLASSPETSTKIAALQHFNYANKQFALGNMQQALAEFDKALSADPQFAKAYSAKTAVLIHLKNFEDALACCDKALQAIPRSAEIYNNRGNILKELGKLQQSLASYDKALEIDPNTPEFYNNKGSAARNLGLIDVAMKSFDKAIELKPYYIEAINNKGVLLNELGKYKLAIEVLDKALEYQPDNHAILNNKGCSLRSLGCMNEALDCFTRALSSNQSNYSILNNIGCTLRDLKQPEKALDYFNKALQIDPSYANALNGKGSAYSDLGLLDQAIIQYKEALRLQPDLEQAYSNLCDAYERKNDINSLRQFIKNAPIVSTQIPSFALSKSRLLKRDGDLDNALDLLKQTLAHVSLDDPTVKVDIYYEISIILDKLNRCHEAFHFAERQNNIAQEIYTRCNIAKESYLDQLQTLSAIVTPDWAATWTPTPHSDFVPTFLVGFPRSGTTLLDTILRSHYGARVVEEKPMIDATIRAFRSFGGTYPDSCALLNEEEITICRSVYYEEYCKHASIDSTISVYIDKLPLNIIHIPLIFRIFPDAKFIFALRHPCDCVLSCFMHNFRPNAPMANFLRLEDAASFYDRVMRLWDTYSQSFPLKTYAIRYEDVVADFNTNISNLLDFLALPWTDAVTRYYETALKRKHIATPSYDQVIKPIYTSARGRWQRYREHLEPVVSVLMPWIEKFGYALD